MLAPDEGATMTVQPDIEGHLLKAGRIDAMQVRSARGHQRQWGRSFEQAVVDLGFMTENDLLLEVASHVRVPYIRIEPRTIPRDALGRLPERLIRTRRVLPLATNGEAEATTLVVAMANPRDLAAIDEVRFAAGMPVQPVLASEQEIDEAIEMRFGKPSSARSRPPA